MNKEDVKEIFQLVADQFTALAKTLEGPAKHLYGVFVKQYIAEGLVYMMFWIVSLLLLNHFRKSISRYHIEEPNGFKNCSEGVLILEIVASGIIGVVMLLITSANITKLFNPEYFAIREIMQSVF